MATTSRRPIDVFHTPSPPQTSTQLNGLENPRSHRRREGYRRNGVDADFVDYESMQPPAAPDVPRGPPISYKKSHDADNVVVQPANSKSFSQRARGYPFAREIFADEGEWDDFRRSAAQRREDARQRKAAAMGHKHNGELSDQPPIDVRRETSTKLNNAPQSSPTTDSSTTPRAVPSQPRHSRRAPDTPRTSDLISPPIRSSTLKDSVDAVDDQKREWASDRSPLQKLEVTLNDISKEEKRARVEEAEMLLRESKAGRAGERAGKEVVSAPTRAGGQTRAAVKKRSARSEATEPEALEGAGLVRSLSSTHRDRLQHSATLDSRKPDRRRLSGEGRRGFEYHEQPVSTSSPKSQGQLPSCEDKPSQNRSIHPAHAPQVSSATRKPVPHMAVADPEHAAPGDDMRRKTSHRETQLQRTVPSNGIGAVSLQEQAPETNHQDEHEQPRTSTMRDVNSSHKAAWGEDVTAETLSAATTATVGRTYSRKLQKAAPVDHGRKGRQHDPKSLSIDTAIPSITVNQAQVPRGAAYDKPQVRVYHRGTPKQVEVQRNNSQNAPKPVVLGLHEDPAAARVPHEKHYLSASTHEKTTQANPATTSPSHEKHRIIDGFHHKQRQPSVSFKEPFDRARPVDEWKHAGTARLTVADLTVGTSADQREDKPWWESGVSSGRRKTRSSAPADMSHGSDRVADERRTRFRPPLYLKCGPLLRYTGIKFEHGQPSIGRESSTSERRPIWRGSVMIVTQDSRSSYDQVPVLRLFSQPKDLLLPPPNEVDELPLEYVDPIAGLTKVSRTGKVLYVKPVEHIEEEKDLSQFEDDNGLFETSPSLLEPAANAQAPSSAMLNKRIRGTDGEALGKYQEVKGVRLYADPARSVTFWRFNVEIELGDEQAHIAYRINRGPAVGFWVPARSQSMNIMFHSCNGFSLSVSPDQFSGPDPLWRDVLNSHQSRPFHVMIGGGDQIYNDRVTVETELFGDWLNLRNPHEKHKYPFSAEMRAELENFYLNRYAMWFSQGLFGMANCQIPMVNVWDDHDIIDGFGSYPDHFMSSPVFKGLGAVAFKYYMLFQHQSVPEETSSDEPSWLVGAAPGPYINERSRSMFMHLGRHVAFLGLDCRTERMRDEVISMETLDLVLERCRRDIVEGETKHLLVLLGIPIAYPRMVWLENILTSRALDPVKALGRLGFIKSGFLNKFDGGVELLDDLDDHWTASHHKKERRDLIQDLQDLAAEKSVRITILGGDVHLAAVGQFYSTPALKIPKDKDHRYMLNVISSAIVNTPPPEMLADVLNKRNKIHRLDEYTDEDMISMFNHDVNMRKRNNKRLLPRRNWCSIVEYQPGSTPPPSPPPPDTSPLPSSEAGGCEPEKPRRSLSFSRSNANPRSLLRRLSSRGAPPSSYRDEMNYTAGPGGRQRPASAGNLPETQDGYFAPQSASSAPQRASFDLQSRTQPKNVYAFDAPPNRRGSMDQSARPIHPGTFQRRPTSHSEKAARKRYSAGTELDMDGNARDDYINLEGGLDITFNCEVSQKDPAGITTPYRLLVPALFYDGSSDREKLDYRGEGLDGREWEGPGVARKPTLLNRLGIGGRRGPSRKLAAGQGSGNWGQGSETESLSGSEGYDDQSRFEKGDRGFMSKIMKKQRGGAGPRDWEEHGQAKGMLMSGEAGGREIDSTPSPPSGGGAHFEEMLNLDEGQEGEHSKQPNSAPDQGQSFGAAHGHENEPHQPPLQEQPFHNSISSKAAERLGLGSHSQQYQPPMQSQDQAYLQRHASAPLSRNLPKQQRILGLGQSPGQITPQDHPNLGQSQVQNRYGDAAQRQSSAPWQKSGPGPQSQPDHSVYLPGQHQELMQNQRRAFNQNQNQVHWQEDHDQQHFNDPNANGADDGYGGYSGVEAYREKPRRSWSLFGGRRRNSLGGGGNRRQWIGGDIPG